MASGISAAALVLAILNAPGCAPKYRTSVALEGMDGPEGVVSVGAARGSGVDRSIRPPHCADPPLPDYPADLVESGIDDILVRVDFLLDTEGRPHEISPSLVARASADSSAASAAETVAGEAAAPLAAAATQSSDASTTPPAVAAEQSGGDLQPFLDAATTAVATWVCSPAWRPTTPGSPRPWILVPYRTWAVFRFDAELIGKKARLERR